VEVLLSGVTSDLPPRRCQPRRLKATNNALAAGAAGPDSIVPTDLYQIETELQLLQVLSNRFNRATPVANDLILISEAGRGFDSPGFLKKHFNTLKRVAN
jgi:hypothetical protein